MMLQERDSVLRLVACVLHLGNVSFQQGDMDNAELQDERSHDALCTVADLLQVPPCISLQTLAYLCMLPLLYLCISSQRSRGDSVHS